MLLRFAVENHLSIKEKQELSLVASALKDREDGLIPCNATPGKRVLPAAVIYGANASGKTNIIDALRFMRRAVVSSHSRLEPGEPIPRSPFRLDPACAGHPSAFEIDFIVAGERYHYGFEALDEAFQSEWLYVFHNNRRQMLFERKAGEAIAFGRGLKGRNRVNRVIEDLTRPNSLFLSTAAQNNHEQLSPVAGFFQDIEIESAKNFSEWEISERLSDDNVSKKIIEFLANIRTGVVDFRRREDNDLGYYTILLTDIYRNALDNNKRDAPKTKTIIRSPSDVISEATAQDPTLGERLRRPLKFKWPRTPLIELAHRDSGGNIVFFDLERESAGTQRLLGMLGTIYHALDKGTFIVIDELDASLHTQASEAVLALVSTAALNPKEAQLITTTHDTNLLRSELLRRDQIWFTEKDEGGATHLYPLSDFSTRQGDNIEKGYLQGRFGAIPFAGSVADLLADG
ncbi:MAG: ATP-binding protein [Defluviicoccus sp.]|nr:ATP-binding protein [Defluviicoccus sp.]MDG4593287.1 ATP-binding protein [Defluviicoccus sp.]MDS4072341.1 ATP-binding protein [Defluviicoccus sp.]